MGSMSSGWCVVLNTESWSNLRGMREFLVLLSVHGRLVVDLEKCCRH
jgi:hypothetical protein